MSQSPFSSEPDLLKTVLQPLLEDFQYWFGRSQLLLETESLGFMSAVQQTDLLERVRQAQQEVGTAQMLLRATHGQVGVETAVLIPWHHLVTECWQVTMKHRQEHLTWHPDR
jgi:Protein of unknown function (DUF2605)